MSRQQHVVIVGGGVIGLATAWYCLKAGHRVTVVDRSPKGHRGCSFGNAGLIVPSHFVPLASPGMVGLGLKMMLRPRSPFYIKPRASLDLVKWMWKFNRACTKSHVERSAPLLRDLHMKSRENYMRLADEFGNGFGLEKSGLMVLCKTESMLHEEIETAKLSERLNVPVEILNRSELQQRFSPFEVESIGAVFYPDDCLLSPSTLMHTLTERLESDGVTILWDRECTGFQFDGKTIRSILTQEEKIEGDHFVIASGVWSTEMAEKLGLSLPMQPGKGYSITIENPNSQPPTSCILSEARVAVTPMLDELRFGGTMELAGINDEINEARVGGIIDSIPDYFPSVQIASTTKSTAWSGLRPVTPDGLPYLGPAKQFENLIVSTGHAMLGLSLAMVSGEMVTDWIAGSTPKFDQLNLISPDRYG